MESVRDFIDRGGIVMWPLLALSLLVVTLCVERAWFFVAHNHPGRLRRVERIAAMLRRGDSGDRETVRQMAAKDGSVYGDVVLRLLDEPRLTDAAIVAAVESQRRRLERFMPTLSTIITAAPMLGILGTVLGIIDSFELLSAREAGADPAGVSRGIAEALITTAAGLIVALVALFPYNAFRAQIERMLSRIEALCASAASVDPPSRG